MWIGPLPTYLITDPDDALTLSNACLKKPYIYNFLDAWLGNVSLLYSLPHKWRAQRKQLNTFFNQRYLNGFLEVFNEQAAMLVNMFEPHVGGEAFDFKHYLIDNTLDTIKSKLNMSVLCND
ncbi:hypothetical protein JYU34_019346 [Plutella xylostella]|uniref:Cytochrome P450 n=1 Tax=Plutella xylostella TaxID=51655 RepID=A0ABQ7PWL1_PLUXY|nr:hypothetical protein JYU34_019346 [Plutella xylostella]